MWCYAVESEYTENSCKSYATAPSVDRFQLQALQFKVETILNQGAMEYKV